MRLNFINAPALAIGLTFSLAACGPTIEEAATDAPAVDAAAVAPAPSPAPAPGGALVPEMQPTGDMASSFGTAPVGGAPAQPTGSAVPEMTPTGAMKQAVNPNQPSQPAPAPAPAK